MCKETRDEECASCVDKMVCRTFLELKKLDEYDDKKITLPIPKGKMEWDNEMPIIVTARRNPILGVEYDANVSLDNVPTYIVDKITNWVLREAEPKLKKEVDNVGITKTFLVS